MSYKLFCVSLGLLLIFCTKAYADTLKLEGFDEKIDVKILEMNEESIRVIILQREIGSISIEPEVDDKYPDTVLIIVNGKKSKVICKIVKITKNPGGITLQIPRENVAAMQIAFPGSAQDTNNNQNDTFGIHSGERPHPPLDAERLKEQIKNDLRHEFEIKQERQEQESVAIEDRIREKLRSELESKEQIREKAFEAENFGKVTGRMLFKGKPLPGCQVKIIMLERWGIFGNTKEGLRFETITDEDGRYFFEKVQPGGYKIYWKPPHESTWIRSIKMEPDMFVEAGETYRYRDRETNLKTAN